jgi:hypothetical protein
MGRLRLLGITVCAVLALSGSARAAEITRVATAGEPGNPIDIDFSIRWDRMQETATIAREAAVDLGGGNLVYDSDLPQLKYKHVWNAIVPRFVIGIYRDVEFHVEIPYVLANDDTWEYAEVSGVPVSGPLDTIGGTTIDANGDPCGGTCALFPVGGGQTVYHGGKLGDLVAGFAWAILSEKRDPSKPTWVLGLDITMPTTEVYDPASGRDGTWRSPHADEGNPGPFGQGLWGVDLSTAISRRMGPVDPYFKAHVTMLRRSANTYSNCDEAAFMITQSPQQISDAAANCSAWDQEGGAQPPYLLGAIFGMEIIPYENDAAGQRVTIDLRLKADYTSGARFYNELSDALGKILKTEDYLTTMGSVGVNVKASQNVALEATVAFGKQSSHFLTGESLTDDAATGDNPNYDYRYDTPGHRFSVTEVNLFDVSVKGILRF